MTWRVAIVSGSRIDVRLIAAFQAISRRAWLPMIDRALGVM